jgi:ribosomal protein S18 acetylase RimI-like enzyme
MLRAADPSDTPALVALANATGIFRPHEAEALLGGMLDDLHAGRLGDGHRAEVWADGPDGPPTGWVYFAPTATADGVWDLWWIGVAPAPQGRGIGGELLRSVEAHVRAAGGRLLLIETSSLPALDPTRRFYARHGYAECGRVPDFYADGDAKVIYAKRVADRADGEG